MATDIVLPIRIEHVFVLALSPGMPGWNRVLFDGRPRRAANPLNRNPLAILFCMLELCFMNAAYVGSASSLYLNIPQWRLPLPLSQYVYIPPFPAKQISGVLRPGAGMLLFACFK